MLYIRPNFGCFDPISELLFERMALVGKEANWPGQTDVKRLWCSQFTSQETVNLEGSRRYFIAASPHHHVVQMT